MPNRGTHELRAKLSTTIPRDYERGMPAVYYYNQYSRASQHGKDISTNRRLVFYTLNVLMGLKMVSHI